MSVQETSNNDNNNDTSSGTDPGWQGQASSLEPRALDLDDLRKAQTGISSNLHVPSLRPKPAHFSSPDSIKFIAPDIDENPDTAERCFVLLPHSDDTKALEILALRLRREHAHSAIILLRRHKATPAARQGLHSTGSSSHVHEANVNAVKVILKDIIKNGLIDECHFQHRNIVILGHRRGGTLALAIAALWNDIEFGGVVSIGGALPAYAQPPSPTKARTTVLILGGELGDINAHGLRQIEETFIHVDQKIWCNEYDIVPETPQEMRTLIEYLAHRLRREEWGKQAVISFDGGGIRGYGSLLILQDLMEKIGELEKKYGGAESSFAPCVYKPTKPRSVETNRERKRFSTASKSSSLVATDLDEPPSNSALFLPCHYFTYAAGTSTGGLISIMLSRFRMTVKECIKEYEILGEEIFGHPRRLAKGALLWHKYSHGKFESVVRDVCSKYSEKSDFEANLGPFPEDVCGTIVLAYADNPSAPLEPYVFRTYHRSAGGDRKKSKARQRPDRNLGGPSNLPIWKVARATSAAPGYFKPVKINRGNDANEVTRFKDGGFGSNNPSAEAYQDIIAKHGDMESNMGPFVSIGTGIPPLELFSKKKGNFHNTMANFNAAKRFPSTTVKVHEQMVMHSKRDRKDMFPYFRFDGGQALGEIALDEWESKKSVWSFKKKKPEPEAETLKKIKLVTQAYLYDPEVQADLWECAELLVKRRRLRSRDASRWERYASMSYYICGEPGCKQEQINEADQLKEHMKAAHRVWTSDQDLDSQIRKHRYCGWVYPRRSAPQTASAQGKRKATS